MKQKPNESFTDYYTRWAAKELLLKDRLSVPEMIVKLLDGALPIYRRNMALDDFTTYNKVCQKAERIERQMEMDPSYFISPPVQAEPKRQFYKKATEMTAPFPPAPAKAKAPAV